MDGQWLKITKNLFDSSCDTIKTRILKNMDTVNLNEISVQLHRMGGQDWAQVNTAEALMSFSPDPTWTQQALETNIKARSPLNFSKFVIWQKNNASHTVLFFLAGTRAGVHREASCLHGQDSPAVRDAALTFLQTYNKNFSIYTPVQSIEQIHFYLMSATADSFVLVLTVLMALLFSFLRQHMATLAVFELAHIRLPSDCFVRCALFVVVIVFCYCAIDTPNTLPVWIKKNIGVEWITEKIGVERMQKMFFVTVGCAIALFFVCTMDSHVLTDSDNMACVVKFNSIGVSENTSNQLLLDANCGAVFRKKCLITSLATPYLFWYKGDACRTRPGYTFNAIEMKSATVFHEYDTALFLFFPLLKYMMCPCFAAFAAALGGLVPPNAVTFSILSFISVSSYIFSYPYVVWFFIGIGRVFFGPCTSFFGRFGMAFLSGMSPCCLMHALGFESPWLRCAIYLIVALYTCCATNSIIVLSVLDPFAYLVTDCVWWTEERQNWLAENGSKSWKNLKELFAKCSARKKGSVPSRKDDLSVQRIRDRKASPAIDRNKPPQNPASDERAVVVYNPSARNAQTPPAPRNGSTHARYAHLRRPLPVQRNEQRRHPSPAPGNAQLRRRSPAPETRGRKRQRDPSPFRRMPRSCT